jgi:hypothetical protein
MSRRCRSTTPRLTCASATPDCTASLTRRRRSWRSRAFSARAACCGAPWSSGARGCVRTRSCACIRRRACLDRAALARSWKRGSLTRACSTSAPGATVRWPTFPPGAIPSRRSNQAATASGHRQPATRRRRIPTASPKQRVGAASPRRAVHLRAPARPPASPRRRVSSRFARQFGDPNRPPARIRPPDHGNVARVQFSVRRLLVVLC